MDEKGVEIDGECNGYLCVKNSWPGAFRTLYGDHERYETTYFKPFPGYYFTGDGCSRYVGHNTKIASFFFGLHVYYCTILDSNLPSLYFYPLMAS